MESAPARPMRKRKRGARRSRRPANRGASEWSIFQLKPLFPGQQVGQFWVLADPIKLTTTVTTGVIANTTTLQASIITNFATRFQMWDENRLVRAVLEWRCFSSSNPGVVRGWVEPWDTATPTLAMAEASEGITFSASDITRPHVLDFKIFDPSRLDFTSGTSSVIGYVKTYTNNANYGASTVATDYLVLHIRLLFQFRGLSTA